MVDANQGRLACVDDRCQVAEAADVADVERGDVVGALDLMHGMRARVGAFGNQKIEALGDPGGVRDRDRHATRAQQVPEADFAADPVPIGVDVGSQYDVLRAGERRRNVASRPGTLRRNGNAVRVHVERRKIIA